MTRETKAHLYCINTEFLLNAILYAFNNYCSDCSAAVQLVTDPQFKQQKIDEYEKTKVCFCWTSFTSYSVHVQSTVLYFMHYMQLCNMVTNQKQIVL